MYRFGNTGALPAEENSVVARERKTMQCYAPRRRHQDQSGPWRAVGQESPPRGVPANRKVCCVIEGRALETPVVEQEPARFDQIDLDPKAGGEPQQGAGILRNVRLEQGEAQTTSKAGFSSAVERNILAFVYTRLAADLCGSLSHSSLFSTV